MTQPVNTNALQNNPNQPISHNQLFTMINYQNQNYRILTNQYKAHDSSIKFWAVFWMAVSIVALSTLIGDASQANQKLPLIILGVSSSVMIFVSAFTIINRSKLARVLPISCILLNTFLISCFILACLQQKIFTYVGVAYILIDSLLSCCLMQNRPIIFARLLIFLQLLMILLKVDQKIQAQWKSILIGIIALLFLFAVIIIFSGMFLLANTTCYFNAATRYKNFGIAFLILSLFSCGFPLSIPVVYSFFQLKIWIFCIPTILANIATVVFLILSRLHIIVFYSRLQQIKPFNQIISCIQIKDQKQLKKRFIVKSQNWCVYQGATTGKVKIFSFFADSKNSKDSKDKQQKKESQPVIQSQTQIKSDTVKQKQEVFNSQCLVCLSSKADMIWINCGHLTCCFTCFKSMLQKKSICCILCKAEPEKVFQVQESKDSKNCFEILKGYSIRIS